MSEHFDPTEPLTITCDRCGCEAGGWDEREGWYVVPIYDGERDVEVCCPECSLLWRNPRWKADD